MSSLRITLLADIAAAEVPWHRPALLVMVEGGSGVLRQQLQRVSEHDFQRTLMLGEVPLVHAHLDDYGCPTCLKLLALGVGRDKVDPVTVAKLREASLVPNAPIASGLDNLSPLLALLEDGVYTLSWVPHYPTNGQREPFWALSQRLRYLESTIGWANNYWLYGDEIPAFLLPTQSFDTCDWERVEDYRAKLRGGVILGGLAYESEGFLSALVDGHHRATAALLEGTTIDCLTVMEPWLRGTKGAPLEVYDHRIEIEALPPAAVRLLHRRDDRWQRAKPVAQTIETERSFEFPDTPQWSLLRKAASKYPDVSDVAARGIVEGRNDRNLAMTDECLARLLTDPRRHWDDLLLVAQALFTARDPRALGLALRLGRETDGDFQLYAFRYLATQRAPKVEAFFIDYCVNDEGKYPELTDIVNDYLTELHAAD